MKISLPILLTLFMTLLGVKGIAQCTNYNKLKIGGDYNSDSYIDVCPTYKFSPDAKYSDIGYFYLDRPQSFVPKYVVGVQESLEKKLEGLIGEDFSKKLTYKGVSISYYDSIAKFHARYPVVDLLKCKTKYFFYYEFEPVKEVKFCVGIALDDNQKIISDLPFPDEQEKLYLDPELNVCKVLEIAKASQTPIEPIDFVSFEFDPTKREFFWVVRQKIANPKKGINEYNQILIEARDHTQIVSYRRTVYIE
ncbi:MAG: hypothetical protein LBE34_02900 [Flavobacteriaceae bacterium]|jgi:hypothetical protein|nr:hypothetical protein [Flavobacteriaceae bacterium]